MSKLKLWPSRVYGFIVFATGASILGVEMSASRLLAPYFGSSMYVWANIIGVVLAALSFGYLWGGRLADRRPSLELLLKILLYGALYIAIIPVLVRPVAYLATAFPVAALIVGSFVASLLLFAAPVFLLGAVSPFVIRLATTRVEEAGKVAGSLYAYSTIGSILGTFLSAFVTIPFLGTRETIFLSSVLLLVCVGVASRKPAYFLLLVFPIALWALMRETPIAVAANVVAEEETNYHYVSVAEENGRRFLFIDNGLGIQSVYDPDSIVTGYYYDYYLPLLFAAPREEKSNVLIIGLAGGTIARGLQAVGDPTITGVEIDPEIVEIAREWFALDESGTAVHVGDGRAALREDSSLYDLVIVDAYSQQLYIPFHLATKEFFEEAEKKLADGGIVAMNVNAASLQSPLLRGILSTLRSVFPVVSVAKVGREDSLNYLIVASASPLAFRDVPPDVPQEVKTLVGEVQRSLTPFEPAEEDRTFTDNSAPVELYTDRIFFELLRETL